MEQAAIMIFFILYYWFMGKQSSTMLTIGYVFCLLSTLLILAFPESPRLLLA